VEDDDEILHVLGDYSSDLPSLVGRYPLLAFGDESARSLRANIPFVIDDVETDPRVDGCRDIYRAMAIRAVVAVPLRKGGRFVAALAVTQQAPRRWSADEIELLKLVAARCWESIERVHVTDELRESEHRYRFLANTIPQMVWTATPDGKLDYINRQGPEFLGIPEERIMGTGWPESVHPEDRAYTLQRWEASRTTNESYETAFRLRRSDNTWRWHLARAVPLIGESGMVEQWFGTCTDISDQRAIEEELRRKNRELEEFAYVASHDLQEPLRMVNIYTQQILRAMPGDNPRLAQYGGFVQQHVRRMEALISGLLTFSRTIQDEDGPPESADLTVAVANTVAVLKSRIEECGAIIHSEPLPMVRGDVSQLEHVFQNLLSNALKYRKKDVRPIIRITAAAREGGWVISVRDNGIGFEQQYSERIFGLFKRLHKDEYEGTGLGLAICKRIVERYGGRIRAESNLGEGAVFYIFLPDAEA
jgi:PAS domain S-box-containing protein